MKSDPIIKLDSVTYQYPASDRPALRDYSLQVGEGEFLLAAGVSGAGKSTLLRLLNGLVPHFYGGRLAGRIGVAGRDPVELGPGGMSDAVGLVFQDPEAQFVAEVVEDEIAFGMENAGFSLPTMHRRVEEVLYALRIEHLRTRRVSTLSGGERQRVAIAAVLTLQPRVLVLDEPTSQLDPQSAEEVLDALVRLNQDLGLTIVLSEHRLERVVQHADRILYLDPHAGPRIGPPREVLAQVPLTPPIVQVGKLLGWDPLPLSIREARRFAHTPLADGGSAPSTQPQTQPSHSQPAIAMREVRFSYGPRELLHRFSLDIAPGAITALLGRNGAGKSTILKLAVGLLKPSSGQVVTAGRDTRHTSLHEMAGFVGYVPQQPDSLLFADSVQGEIDFTRRAQGLPPDGAELISRLDLTRHRESDPRDLSVGERQRVALAAVLAGRPAVLVLDEPTRGLDYAQKERLASTLRQLRGEGCTVVLATHDVELAAQMADRVLLLGEGRVLADGPPQEVMSDSLTFSTQVGKLFRDPQLLTVEDVAQRTGK